LVTRSMGVARQIRPKLYDIRPRGSNAGAVATGG
jgi:hypothetical protein